MRNLTIITVMLLVLTSCASASRDYIYNTYTTYPNKATAVALNSYGQFTGGWGLGGGNTLSQAKSEALNRCKQHNPQNTCVLERENNINVFNQSLASFRKQQQQAYIASIRAKCKGYGFADNAIAVCVQQEVNRSNSPQQSSAKNYNWDAISDFAKCIGEGPCWGNPKHRERINTPSATQQMGMKYFLVNSSVVNGLTYCRYGGGHVTTKNFGLCPQSIVR